MANQSYPTDWTPGVLRGNVLLYRKGFRVLIRAKGCRVDKRINSRFYESEEEAKKAAYAELKKINIENDLTANDYRSLDDNTVEVKLDKGYTMLIDAKELSSLRRFRWWTTIRGHSVYAMSADKRRHFYFHSLALPCPNGLSVDHIKGTLISSFVLDNRRSNLRIATRIIQNNNMPLRRSNTSGFNGVKHDPKKFRFYSALDRIRES